MAQAQSFFEHIDRSDGLPGDQVLALHEDRSGFIWIGTESGLARHEGVRIRTWLHDRKDAHSLPNNVVWDIVADEHGAVWVATDHGLARYDARTGGFDRVFITTAYHDPTSANRIHKIVADGHGRLWLSTEDGIHVIALDGVPVQTTLPAKGALIARLTDRMRAHDLQVDAQRIGVWINAAKGSIFFDAKAEAWITTSTDPRYACLNDPLTQDVLPDGTGGLWYFSAGTKELVHTDADGQVTARELITTSTDQLVNPQFMRLDHDARLWLSTWSHELRIFDQAAHAWEALVHDDARPWSISNSNTKSWLQDRDGRIWLGTYAGLNVLDPAHGAVQPYRVGDEGAWLNCLLPMDGQRVLVGTNAGLMVMDRETGSQRMLLYDDPLRDAIHTPYVNSIHTLRSTGGGYLIGTYDGLMELDSSGTRYGRPTEIVDQDARLRQGMINFIQPDPSGNTWVGRSRGGLFKIDVNGHVAPFDSISFTPLPSRALLSCATGDEGTWFGLNNGGGACLVRNDSIVRRILHEADPDGASYGVVLSLALDDAGTLYIGTLMGGLGVLAKGSNTIDWHTRSDGLTGDRVETLVLDDSNGLWVGTNDGLCRFDRTTREIEPINVPASLRKAGRFSAIAIDHDGSLLCAFGPLLIDVPTARPAPTNGPPVILTGLRYGNRSMSSWTTDSTIVLHHDARALSIEFGARAFFSDREVRFAYRIVDMDSAWRSIGTTSRLDLNDLPRGEHHLEVRANNGGSNWTAVPLALHIEVLPPFWSTWWFRVLVVLGIALLAWLGVRYYVQERLAEVRAAHQREQAVLSERVRIAGDMHDDLGAGLSGLKLRSEMALRVEKDPAKREHLSNLANTAGELIGSMRQIIWTMTADQASIEDLVVYTSSYARSYCEENGLAIDVHQPGPWPEVLLTTEQRRNIFLVVKEALHNTVKHAQAQRVQLKMQWAQGLSVVIHDDGIGLPKGADQVAGNGLRNMEKRITALGGTFRIEAAEGTRIGFRVPLADPPSNQGSIGGPTKG